MPFGWSTAVGDFNRDGKADLAIADETGRRPAGYAYRIELALSGSARYDVTFETAQAAVAISVADIDGDRDVDLLLTVPLSDRRIGIFLNDGRGQFRSADVGLFPAGWLMDGGLDLDTVLRTIDTESLLTDDEAQHYRTLGGLAMAALGRVPRTGDVFERRGHRFEVVDMDRNRVDRVLVSRSSPAPGTDRRLPDPS